MTDTPSAAADAQDERSHSDARLAVKRALRAEMRAKRDAFAMQVGGVIAAPPALVAQITPGTIVASYVPMGSEADPSAIAWAAREAGATIVLPHVTSRKSNVRFFKWEPEIPLIPGPWGLLQPDDSGPEIDPDIILTPMLAFDANLNRLGQGAGHYDRAFARLPNARRIGVAWSAQQVDRLDTDPWDVPLHAVVTEVACLGELGE